jgi:hypothetical protein
MKEDILKIMPEVKFHAKPVCRRQVAKKDAKAKKVSRKGKK